MHGRIHFERNSHACNVMTVMHGRIIREREDWHACNAIFVVHGRICFCGPEEGRLISPCLCKGSMKYVHLDCLQHWRQTSSNSKRYGATYARTRQPKYTEEMGSESPTSMPNMHVYKAWRRTWAALADLERSNVLRLLAATSSATRATISTTCGARPWPGSWGRGQCTSS
jgi:hypothetical protein